MRRLTYHGRLGARTAQKVGAGKATDIVCHLEKALGGSTTSVNDTLRDAFTVELGESM